MSSNQRDVIIIGAGAGIGYNHWLEEVKRAHERDVRNTVVQFKAKGVRGGAQLSLFFTDQKEPALCITYQSLRMARVVGKLMIGQVMFPSVDSPDVHGG